MSKYKKIFIAASFIPTFLCAASSEPPPSCSSNCGALIQRLENLNCSNAIPEANSFLLNGHKLVLAIHRNATHRQNEIAIFRNGLQSRRQTMTDCFNKHRTNKEFSIAILPLLKVDFAVERLSENPEMPQQAREMLI